MLARGDTVRAAGLEVGRRGAGAEEPPAATAVCRQLLRLAARKGRPAISQALQGSPVVGGLSLPSQ